MPPFRVGFCVSGAGRLARAAITYADQLGISPSLLLADHRADSELERFCAKHATPFARLEKSPRTHFNDSITRACVDAKLDLLVLTFGWLVQPALVAHYDRRIINVHPALLPAFPGIGALETSVAAGVRYIGATIHEVDNGVDTGPIIAQCILALRSDDTAATAGARLFNNMRLMYLQVIRWYVEGRVVREERGLIKVENARYGEFPISPAVERSFVD